MRDRIAKILKKAAPHIEPEVAALGRPEFGHFSTNVAMRLASEKGENPRKAAGELVEKITAVAPKEFFERIEIAGPGFINFWIEKKVLQAELTTIYKKKEAYGKSGLGKGKNVIVEYSSPNIAKPMHVGHLRSTVIGDALANIHEFLGYKVVRWNYIGDWGTQFGKLTAAYKLWGKKNEVEKAPIETLNKLYIKFHDYLERRPELEGMGREEFRKLEEGDKENHRLWQWFRKESLNEFGTIYKRLGVKFDVSLGESFYENDLKPLIERLIRRSLAEESEGALVVRFDKQKQPALIRKSDGATLYITRDLANIEYRAKKYKPAKILYVVANEQALHFEQLFAIAKMLGIHGAELEHVKFGLVLGEGGEKLSTREGKTVHLEDVLQKIIRLAHSVVSKKNPSLPEREKKKIAEAVGVGALKYNDLREHRHSDIVFDWDKMLDFRGDSAPYLQYTYARIQGIKRKVRAGEPDLRLLSNNLELSLILKLANFPDVLRSVCDNYLPNALALYLYNLAVTVNKFYETLPVMKEENIRLRAARLVLLDATAGVLKRGLQLLGISVLKKI